MNPGRSRTPAPGIGLWLMLIVAPWLQAAPGHSAAEAEPATEVALLREQVRRLEARIERLESRLAESSTPDPEAAISTPGEPLNASATPPRPAVIAGGRVKLDAIFSSTGSDGPGGSSRGNFALLPGTLPLGADGEDNQLTTSARDSRFWIRSTSRHETPLEGYLEVDFVGSSPGANERVTNSWQPRLRHAWVTLGPLGVGQTTTTLFNLLAFPETADANGPAGILNVRQPQVRLALPLPFGQALLALEQPETVLTTTAGSRLVPGDDRWPDIIGRLDVESGRSQWSVAALVRQLRVDGALVPDAADESWGLAVTTSGRISLTETDELRFALSSGRGLGRYLSYNAFDDGVIDSAGHIDSRRSTGGFLAVRHWWNDDLRSNLVIGAATTDIDDLGSPVNHRVRSTHLNLLWSPAPATTLGIEWIQAKRTLTDGSEGALDRVQLSTFFRF